MPDITESYRKLSHSPARGQKRRLREDKKVGRQRRPELPQSAGDPAILVDFWPGPESEFDLAQVLRSFFVARDKHAFHMVSPNEMHSKEMQSFTVCII